ncbi:MAG: hypothetical protein ABIG71_04495, partial [Candidatus Uhrbacteria bacterium]
MRQFLFCAVLCTVLAIASTARAEPRTFEIAISYEIAVTNEDVPLRMDLIVHNELCLVKTQQCWADNTMCRAALNTQF